MHPAVETRYDRKRGCGWRSPGTYLVSDGVWSACGMLPIPLDFCPCCGRKSESGKSVVTNSDALQLSRGWTWIEGSVLRANAPICQSKETICGHCTMRHIERAGMMWVGVEHYKTPAIFMAEGVSQGISKRIASLPTDFVVGETPVALAHRRTIHTEVKDPETGKVEVVWMPGIFAIFTPTSIEYVVKGTETDEEIARMIARGITPVRIIRIADTQLEIAGANGQDTQA